MAETISRSIFKAYDIRGIVDKTLTEEVCEKVGMALGTLAQKKNVSHICVGRDGRLSGPRLQAALMKGIRKAGVGVYRHRCGSDSGALFQHGLPQDRKRRCGYRKP